MRPTGLFFPAFWQITETWGVFMKVNNVANLEVAVILPDFDRLDTKSAQAGVFGVDLQMVMCA